ncbi:hypothetical protein A5893_17365 [Pedobacter psychrophilus]|uniref:Uncharacterized protein n=1 Tax=Pedobacter psychrophilus TaxID=1826909 RepID=A0A179DK45_9SPHI|nr:hypothetical protein [Pedobacter psychrophilus]OAQ41391.1 hypothetical protein A5893_17365 [Pedobacter psychrophilus]
MTEIEISNGQNIIDIFFDDFASCLVIKKALAVNWPDCGGSIGEYYSISDFSINERNFYTKNINTVLAVGSDLEQIEAIKEFLNLFSNGKYSINKGNSSIENLNFLSSQNVIYSESVPEDERFSGAFFPPYWKNDYEPCLFSITNDKINPNQVDYYCQLIKEGKRPTVLTFLVYNNLTSNYSCSYVLDGHHKIQAYLKLNESIPILNILKSEDCINKTASLLKYTKAILKDFEYKHLFINNDENLLTLDFVNNIQFSSDLDDILKNASSIDTSIIYILKKYSNSLNRVDIDWLELRLNSLRKNKNFEGFGKGIWVYEKHKDKKYENAWFQKGIFNLTELDDWIRKTIK